MCARNLGAGATSLAIHLNAGLLVVWLSSRVVMSGVAATPPARGGPPLALFAQATSASNAAPGAERPPTKPLIESKNASGPAAVGLRIDKSTPSTLEFTGFSIDIGKVTSRAAALFPFLTRQLSFHPEEHVAKPASSRLINPFSTPGAQVVERPLLMSDAEVQRAIDQAWSRRERWAPFQSIRSLIEAHSPDVGQVAPLIRGYVTQNAFQPYVEPSIRDPRIWTQLALAADHELFLDFIVDYASQHPGTRATVELLFFLDILAKSSQDTLLLLLEIDPQRDLGWTRQANPAAFKAITNIHDHYAEVRQARGLASHKALVRYYDEIRLGILTTIVQTAPDDYRVNDARYLIGEIHWRRDRRAEARAIWRQMHIDPRDRFAASSRNLLDVLHEAGPSGGLPPSAAAEDRPVARAAADDLDPQAINRVLDAEYDRWITASRVRLLQFGYRMDSF